MARYGRKASEKVEEKMHEMKRGQLRSGRSGKKVKSRRQAIAIGLSEARREGGKVPRAPRGSRSSSRSSRSSSSRASSRGSRSSGGRSSSRSTRGSSSRRSSRSR